MANNFVARSPLYLRKTPGGVFVAIDESQGTGNVFWVSSTSSTKADSVGSGYSPDAPFATLAYALTQCTASQGDRIYVMEAHAENVIAASTIAWSVAGVKVIGLGSGDLRPTFTWNTIATATMTMSSANCRITNCIFDLTIGSVAIVSGIVVSAAGCQIDNCYFKVGKAGTGTAPIQAILTTAGANRLAILNNDFIGPAATPTTVSAGTNCICVVGGTGVKIQNNNIHGWFTTSSGGILGLTTLSDNILIDGNKIGNQTASSTKAIVLLTGSTGWISNNRLGILSSNVPVTADTCFFGGNTYTATQGVTAGTASTF